MAQDAIPAGWTQTGEALTRTIERSDFVEALALMLEIGRLAEAADHHPDITVCQYRKVKLSLSSHSAGNTVTDKDFALAQKINEISEDAIRLTKQDLKHRFSIQ